MAQHDYIIDNQTSANLRVDLNNALAAIVSQNSGATAPATTYANQFWYDTSTDTLKQRNESNTVWVSLGTVDQTNNKFEPNQTFATQAEAQAGTNNTKSMTALRTAQAITTLTPINVGVGSSQTWQNPSRAINTTYQNTTSRPILVVIGTNGTGATVFIQVSVDNVTFVNASGIKDGDLVHSIIVPVNSYYRVNSTGTTINAWSELR